MARQPKRRCLNGARRRRPMREVGSLSRWMHLYHTEVSKRHKLQTSWLRSVLQTQSSLLFLSQLLMINALLSNNLLHQAGATAAKTIIECLIQLANLQCSSHRYSARSAFILDHLFYDITPEEESRPLLFKPHQGITFASWDDQKCLNYTSFYSRDLRRIYNLFGLQNLADDDGKIRIHNGHYNQDGHPCNYAIDSEELFLFFMTRFKKGSSILDLVNDIFGGDHGRWKYAWPWMLRYLDRRYETIIGHQGLLRFRDDFPAFFDSIEKYVKKPKWHLDEDGEWWWSPGLAFCPYRIFGFIDCSIYRMNVPFSGPSGNFKGAPRKRKYAVTQEAFYTGWTHVHGLKVEVVYLPNGISTVYGPMSCRRPDIGGGSSLQDTSGLNAFLRCIQRNLYQTAYSVLGDKIYGVNLDCIRSYYSAYFRRNQMTEYMRICDAEMKACRQSIEWNFGKNQNVFSICKDPDQFKLGKQNPYAMELLRVTHLMTNMYNCVNGDMSSGYGKFDCAPPKLEEYLAL